MKRQKISTVRSGHLGGWSRRTLKFQHEPHVRVCNNNNNKKNPKNPQQEKIQEKAERYARGQVSIKVTPEAVR